MKQLTRSAYLLAWLVFTSSLGFAQFGPSTRVVNISPSPGRFAVGDLNGDGQADIVCTSFPENKAWLYMRGPGSTFSAPVELADLSDWINTVEFIDVDEDGDPDVLLGADSDLWWVINLGSGIFGPAVSLLSTPAPSSAFAMGDLDGDGLIDLVTSGFHSDRRVHFGLGGGLFGPSAALSLPIGEVHDLHVMDLDGDAFLDLIVGFVWDSDDWLIEFDATRSATATNLVLDESDFFASGDMDGDGDQDLVRSSYFTGELGWYENQGGVLGAFIASPGIIPSFSPPVLGDIDGDGDLDIVAAGDGLDQLVWVENLNGVALGNHVDLGSPGGASSLALLDFNGDGTLDVLVNDVDLDTIELHLNQPIISSVQCTALPNSASSGAALIARGSEAAVVNWVRLELDAAPPLQFTLLINSQTPGNTMPAGSMGVMCLGGTYGRYLGPGEVGRTDPNGRRTFTLDLPNTPTMTTPTAILSGETWYFQAWFRDRNPGPTSNFSNAIAVSFL